jgi:hypothetical protein
MPQSIKLCQASRPAAGTGAHSSIVVALVGNFHVQRAGVFRLAKKSIGRYRRSANAPSIAVLTGEQPSSRALEVERKPKQGLPRLKPEVNLKVGTGNSPVFRNQPSEDLFRVQMHQF